MTTDRFTDQPSLRGIPDKADLEQLRALIESCSDQPVPRRAAPVDRVARAKPDERFRRDRFGNLYGGSPEEAATRDFSEAVGLLAQGMIEHLKRLNEFRLELRHLHHHAEQVVRVHHASRADFEELVRSLEWWLQTAVCAGVVGRYSFAGEFSPKELKAGAREVRGAQRDWRVEVCDCVSLGEAADYLPRTDPFHHKTFAELTPEELLTLVHEYWFEALTNLAKAFIQFVSNGVDQGPFGRVDSLFGLFRWDEVNRKGVYGYWTREQDRRDTKTETTVPLWAASRLAKKTITTTTREVRQLAHHIHTITNVERYDAPTASVTPALAMPPEIVTVVNLAPAFLKPHLAVFAGNLVHAVVVRQDITTKKHATEQTQYVRLPCEPALVLYGFVLCGWGPAEMRTEVKRRAQVRLRHMRLAQIEQEKRQASARHKKEVDQVRREAALPLKAFATTVAIVLFAVFAFSVAHANSLGVLLSLAGLVAITLLVPIPYCVCVVSAKWRNWRQLRSEVAKLDTETSTLKAEVAALRATPISEL